ncbi:MAG: hypothetical protein FGF48_02620 [Candidatus Brockarchaeota archaeon]|nr:hypothetical protein [Candidatus Brockarchaeota archaeon]
MGSMKRRTPVSLALILLVLSMIFSTSFPQEPFNIEKAMLTVYRDGNVRIEVELSIDESEFSITLPLLTSSDKVWEIIVLNGTGALLDYDLNDYNITIYSLGSTDVTLEYYTSALTSKEADLWTIKFSSPFELNVEFPVNATIIYFNRVPSAIKTKDGIISLDLQPGEWEISYHIPIASPQPPTPGSQTDQKTSQPLPTLQIDIIAIVVSVSALVIAFALIKGKKGVGGLSGEEAEIVRYLRERGGRALEAELRERFPYIPRTSMWRTIRRLEKKGIVSVRKIGLQNVVELK